VPIFLETRPKPVIKPIIKDMLYEIRVMVRVTPIPARIVEKASLKLGALAIRNNVVAIINPIAASHQGNEASLVRNFCLVNSFSATLGGTVAVSGNAMTSSFFGWLELVQPAF
jgi:hypothetical protein